MEVDGIDYKMVLIERTEMNPPRIQKEKTCFDVNS